jgi:hypothetical protein
MSNSRTALILVSGVIALLATGCGGAAYSPGDPPTTPPSVNQNAAVTGQHNLILTSTTGRGTTNIYANFTQTGTTFAGAANTLVCPSNDLSQCEGDPAPLVPIALSGTVSGANVTMTISFPTAAGTDTVTMVGTALGTNLAGTYTDSLGDAGTWTASPAIHPVGPVPGVYDYSGTFNSTSNPLLIPPTILIELGSDGSSKNSFNLTGFATITNSPCISSLSLSGEAIGDAFSATDQSNKVLIIALPTQPASPNGGAFNFSYKFDSTAPHCAGDFGLGTLTIDSQPWDY